MSTKDIIFDKGVLVSCPMYKYGMREASHCQLCEFYAGAEPRTDDKDIPQEIRFLIGCGFPKARQLHRYEG